jgi:hypothetical protein
MGGDGSIARDPRGHGEGGAAMRRYGKLSVSAALLVAGLSMGAAAAEAPKPLTPQPTTAELADGLRAQIYVARFQHIDDLLRFIEAAPKPSETRTLPELNFAWGDGNVLGTTSSDLVGAKISGFIRFDQPGTWHLKVTSNDGVRLVVGGVQLFEDPEIHGDSDSPPLSVNIAAPGWYPIDILYYEKKGTATLKLFWQPPKQADFAPVPAAAFAHRR